MLSESFVHISDNMLFTLIGDTLVDEKIFFQYLKEDFIISIEQMHEYLQNMEDSIFIFKKHNWSLEEFYSLPYGSRMYHLKKIQDYLKSLSEES